ncbi:MAG: aminomethyl transferase family protein [Candidatus Omnitrophica bacterium]|nr:aminomethyl transferase family protein [Candidatus Omnitrophota bacterium]
MSLTLLLHGRLGPTVNYAPLGSWLLPWRIGDGQAEYAALQQAAALIDYSTLAAIEVRGADRVSFLQRLVTNDVARLAPGQGSPAALLDANGKMLAVFLILMDQEGLWLLCDVERAALITPLLDRYLFTEEVKVLNHERRWAALAVQGPKALPFLRELTEAAPKPPVNSGAKEGEAALSLMASGDHLLATLEGNPVRLIRHGITGGDGVVLLVEANTAEHTWQFLRDRGQNFGLRVSGWEALNIARIEAGIPWYGIDMDASNLLPETGLEATHASGTKGCYIGQEIVARLSTYGSPNKKLMGLVLGEGASVPASGDEILHEQESIGRITSGCYSWRLKRPIAMGYVKRGRDEPNTPVQILHGQTRCHATVVRRPIAAST